MQYYFIYTVQNYYEILFAKLKIEYLALLYYIFFGFVLCRRVWSTSCVAYSSRTGLSFDVHRSGPLRAAVFGAVVFTCIAWWMAHNPWQKLSLLLVAKLLSLAAGLCAIRSRRWVPAGSTRWCTSPFWCRKVSGQTIGNQGDSIVNKCVMLKSEIVNTVSNFYYVCSLSHLLPNP